MNKLMEERMCVCIYLCVCERGRLKIKQRQQNASNPIREKWRLTGHKFSFLFFFFFFFFWFRRQPKKQRFPQDARPNRTPRQASSEVKGEVQRKMNFTFVLGFVVLRDVVKVFPVSSSSFTRKTTGRNGARSHSGAWRGLKTKWDLKLSLPSATYLFRYVFIDFGTTTPKLKLDAFQLCLRAPEPEFPVIFGPESQRDPLTSAWCQGGASSERLAELPTGVSPLPKHIWKWDFYHCSSCNFFFHICFRHLWCELPHCCLAPKFCVLWNARLVWQKSFCLFSMKAKRLLLKETRSFSLWIETGSMFQRSGPRAEKHFDPELVDAR